jgi:DNA-binding transcriptional ArsR family regulator
LASTTTKPRPPKLVDQRLIKALAHPLREQLLAMLNERVASPNELAKELGEGLSQVSYHIKVLRDYDCIELVKTEPRRGAVEHFYRGIKRVYFHNQDWELLPKEVQSGISANVLQSIVDDAVEALNVGTFDAREDRHLSWTPLVVDEEGWRDLYLLLNETLERILDIQADSSGRLAEAGAEGIPVVTSLMGFEAPTPEQRSAAGPRKSAG